MAEARVKARTVRRESVLAERFALFAECLLTGVWIVVASLPLVTYPAAVAAGARHLRRRTAHEGGGVAGVRRGLPVGRARRLARRPLRLGRRGRRLG
ncbi:hypothetical protein GCM10010145_31120 [Streptomyces ruber]|uniref:Uncharacterized protein n=2 Tax=Streptomyces TaxID=1883 RepID=A0A918EQP7_9ACTN|nr:hypothetical protein GCM10010145_31120 [Streptomyces ruber]